MNTYCEYMRHFKITLTAGFLTCSIMLLSVAQVRAEKLPEYTSFGLAPIQAFPDPESRQYITKTTEHNPDPVQFNGQLDKLTDSVVISGHFLVFEPGHENGLWESYHDHRTLRDLEIHADTVTIHGALHLPQTNVTIYARVLRFEDDQETAFIDTTPYAAVTQGAPLAVGLVGDPGGHITLHINAMEVDEAEPFRFFLRGATGQKGGQGTPGAVVKPTFTNSNFITGNIFNGLSSIYKFTVSKHEASYVVWPKKGLYSRKTWGKSSTRQADGADAKKPGNSGKGGRGGTLFAPVLASLTGKAVFEGGQGGKAAARVAGGAAPVPRTLRHWSCDNSVCQNTNVYTNSAGQSYSGIAGAKGSDGQYEVMERKFSWLTAPLFSQSLRYAKDLYLNGYYEHLEAYLETIIGLVEAYQASGEWGQLDASLSEEDAEQQRDLHQAELLQLLNEAKMLQQRFNSGLDYFSKPFGWVPGLSYEVNQSVFDNEIDTAIDVLWLTHTMQQNINNKQARQNTAKQMVTELGNEIDDLQVEFQKANETLANLGPRINKLEVDIISLQNKMDQYAEQFRDDAERAAVVNAQRDNMFFLSRLNPVPDGPAALPQEGKPILEELKRISEDTAWSGAEIAMGEVDNALDCLAEVGDPKRCAYKEGAKLVQEKIEQTKQQGQLAIDLIRGDTTNNATVNAELQRILAQDPGWLDLAEEMVDLHDRKAILLADFITALDTIHRATSAIGKNQLAIDVFQEEVINTNDILDPRIIAYTEDMAHRARHRLQQYHDYMVKSYQYRLVRAYPFALDLNDLFADFCKLQAANDSNDLENVANDGCQADQVNLSENDFKNLGVLYKEQLSSIAEEIISDYNNGGGVSQDTALEFELPADYLTQINQNPDGLSFNLVDDLLLFNNSEEDIRIRSIEVIDMEFNSPDALTYVDISFKHSGISQIRKAGESYLFQHYLNSDTNPIQWVTRYNGDGSLQGLQTNSSSSRSLIASIIGNNADNLKIFASPGAWAELNVSRSASPSNSSNDVRITRMRIRVNYEYTPTENNISTLHVMAKSIFQAPPIEVLTADMQQRTNGQGNFLRSYARQTQVTLVAPLQFEQLTFEGWFENGQLITTNPRLDTIMENDKTVLPRFIATGKDKLMRLSAGTTSGAGSSTRFYAGTLDNRGDYRQQFSLKDSIDIVAKMEVGDDFQGSRADIYLVALYEGFWFMKDSKNNWVPWDVDIESLLPHRTQELTEVQSLTIQGGLSGLAGNFTIFIGHSSADGNLHYSRKPFTFSVK